MAGNVTALDSKNPTDGRPAEKTPTGWYKYWQVEMDAAEKRLRKFFKQGNTVNDIFLDERRGQNDSQAFEGFRGDTPTKLNLFYTNISTLQSMLYGSTPQIDVAREHHDPDDDIARVAAVMLQRILQADVSASGEDFPTALKAALQDRLLPGLGVCRVRYTFETTKEVVMNPETLQPMEVPKVTNEDAPVDYVHWQDVRWGWGRTWSEIPWWSFRSFLTKDEAKERFGAKKAKSLEYKNQLPSGTENKDETYDTDQKNNVQKAEVWEVWSKKDKKVFWWGRGAEIILDALDDPLQLDGFWPMPRPMTANLTTSLYQPRADYVLAQDLYTEIDELQSRVSTITRAVKVVGVYDKSASDSVGRMLNEGVENDLIPVDNWAMFGEKGGLQGTIDWFPVQEVVATLQTLIAIRDQTIELLYQVTGMSDILRGANTDQYTSDGTQQLKAKFGSIRVQALQDEFARFASDLEALKAEVISKHFQPGSIAHQASAQFLPQADQDKIQPALELMKSPDVKWRIDIRPESIAMVDYAQLKSERTEFLTAMATYIQSAQAAVKAVPGSLPILLEMLKWGMAGFKGSNYLEGTMDQAIDMAKKAPQDQSKDGQKEAVAQQAEMQKIQAKLQADMQIIQAKGQQELQKIQADHQANMAELQAKSQGDIQKIQTDLRADLQVIAEKLGGNLSVEQAQAAFDIAAKETEHAHNMTEEQASHRNALAQTLAHPTPNGGGDG